MKTVLFVDDEPFVLDGLNRILREYRNEWHMLFAANGKDALQMAKTESVDMIITDVRMPEMSGLELLASLQNDPLTQHIPVVILTGDHELSLKSQALDLGAVDLLNKPIYKEDIVSRIRNVLKLKEYQDMLKQKNEALEKQLVLSQKMELVGVMAASAVHDVHNLLSVVIGYSSLFLEKNVLNGDETANMKKIRKAGEKAAHVVNRILTFSRLKEEISIINLNDLVDEILSIIEIKVASGITILWQRPSETFLIKGNHIEIQQVVMNLCLNAVQAMNNSGSLTITLSNKDEFILFTVSDTGEGMSDEVLKHIFSPLFTTKSAGKGTGLGLFVVKHIVEKYKGSVEVHSVPGLGTTFRILIPRE